MNGIIKQKIKNINKENIAGIISIIILALMFYFSFFIFGFNTLIGSNLMVGGFIVFTLVLVIYVMKLKWIEKCSKYRGE